MYEESWFEKHGTKIIIGCLTTFIIIMTTLIYLSVQRTSYLYDQCMKDGKKEYECFSIVLSRQSMNRFFRMLGYEKQIENLSGCATIGVTEVYRLVEEIERRGLTSGTIVVYNGPNTGIGEATYAKFSNEDKPVEITDYGMW